MALDGPDNGGADASSSDASSADTSSGDASSGDASSGDGGLSDALYSLATSIVRATPRELSLTAASTLSTLERRGPQRLTVLAESQGVAQPSMTSLVTRLARAGLVRRQPDPDDARGVLVALAEGGADHLAARRRHGRRAVDEILEHVPATELARLMAALPAIRRIGAFEASPSTAPTAAEVPA